MLGDPARCATHKTVLTSGGTCLLCVRRDGSAAHSSAAGASKPRSVLPWATGLVVGGLFLLAVLFKIYLSVSDRHAAQAATIDPASASTNAPLPTTMTTPTSTPDGIPGTDRASLLAEAKREVVIDVYGASWCPHCNRAKAFLDREGIAYAYHDVDQPSNKTAMRQLNPRGGIPTIKVDGDVLVGFSEGSVRRAINHSAETRVANRGR